MPIRLDGKVIYLPGEKQPKNKKEDITEAEVSKEEIPEENKETEHNAVL